jgi:hypothetical protein
MSARAGDLTSAENPEPVTEGEVGFLVYLNLD